MDDQEYLSTIIKRLKQQKYHIQNDVVYNNQNFKYTAKRTWFERERLGAIFTTFFLFSKFEKPDFQILMDFSKKSYKYSNKSFRIYLPPLLFWGLKCFPVAIVDSLDKKTDYTIRFEKPPFHFGAFEKLVVFNLEDQTLYYWKLSSSLTALADELDRAVIKEILSP